MSLDNTDMKYSIPVVDFQALSINRNLPSGPEDDNKVTKSCQAVCDAFMDVGFVYLKNTGITEKQVNFGLTCTIIFKLTLFVSCSILSPFNSVVADVQVTNISKLGCNHDQVKTTV